MLTDPKLDFLSCMHEEVSVAMCHGYAKIEGKPMAAMMHDTVGLQHGSMAIYNAYADRVPIFLITPSAPDAAHPQDHGAIRPFGAGRRGHRARFRQMGRQAGLAAALGGIRDAGLEIRHDRRPMARCCWLTSTDLQENPIDEEPRPVFRSPPKIAPPQAEDAALREAAKMLVEARGAGTALRPPGAHPGGHAALWSNWPNCCRRRWSTRRDG